jgi:hypothetical protein
MSCLSCVVPPTWLALNPADDARPNAASQQAEEQQQRHPTLACAQRHTPKRSAAKHHRTSSGGAKEVGAERTSQQGQMHHSRTPQTHRPKGKERKGSSATRQWRLAAGGGGYHRRWWSALRSRVSPPPLPFPSLCVLFCVHVRLRPNRPGSVSQPAAAARLLLLPCREGCRRTTATRHRKEGGKGETTCHPYAVFLPVSCTAPLFCSVLVASRTTGLWATGRPQEQSNSSGAPTGSPGAGRTKHTS